MESTPKTIVSARSQVATEQSCYSTGSARANSPTIANAMERMMRKVLTVIIKICITGSLICT